MRPINAYFWACVAVHNDVDGSRRVRILTPSDGFVSDDGVAATAPFPYMYERALGTGARTKPGHDGDYLYAEIMVHIVSRRAALMTAGLFPHRYPNYPKLGQTPTDLSYPFMWWEKRDVWFEKTPDRKIKCVEMRVGLVSRRGLPVTAGTSPIRYNGWADAHGGSFLHGHPNNGTKAWIWGTAPNEQCAEIAAYIVSRPG